MRANQSLMNFVHRRILPVAMLTLLALSLAAVSTRAIEAAPSPAVAQLPSPTRPTSPPVSAPPATSPAAPTGAGPVAAFNVSASGASGNTINGRVHDPIAFDATPSQGTGLSFGWSFGDGTAPVAGQHVSHAFALVDDYQVTLTVADAAGRSASTTQTIRVIPIIDSLVSAPPMKQVMVGAIVPVLLYVQAPGPAALIATLKGELLSSPTTTFSTADSLSYATINGQVADETDATIDKAIIQTLGGSVALQSNVGLDLTYPTSAGNTVDLFFNLSLQKDRDSRRGIWAITYPNFSLFTGATDPSQPDVAGYYLKGDPGFHHADNADVRHYAMQAARDGGPLPSDPAQVTANLYAFTRGLFASDDPAQIEPDDVVVQKIDDGELVPGARDETYICISQTYFLTSLTRTLGLPSRELTIALANPVSQDSSGAWQVDYVQEGAAEVWYNNSWNLYDTWLHIRSFDDYLNQKYAYQAWYSYSAQNYELVAKNGDRLHLFGHNFAIDEDDGGAAAPDQWNLRQRRERSGVAVEGFPTS
jgi:PKD repeat protein